MKYADNITKVFASSSGVVITMVLSAYLFDFSMTLLFNLGTGTSLVAAVCVCVRARGSACECVRACARARVSERSADWLLLGRRRCGCKHHLLQP